LACAKTERLQSSLCFDPQRKLFEKAIGIAAMIVVATALLRHCAVNLKTPLKRHCTVGDELIQRIRLRVNLGLRV
jgi:hypothetical protein